jgi:hypothetical protein
MRPILAISAILLMVVGCQTKTTPLTETEIIQLRIDSLETVLFADAEAPLNHSAGMQLVKSYAKYYQLQEQKDSVGVDMLFKAGEVSMAIEQGNLAVKYFRTIAFDHEEMPKAADALFLAGFCEENVNKDTADARQLYELFIKKYPEHKLAEDAKFSIQNMSMSDEELIRMFEEKAKVES